MVLSARSVSALVLVKARPGYMYDLRQGQAKRKVPLLWDSKSGTKRGRPGGLGTYPDASLNLHVLCNRGT